MNETPDCPLIKGWLINKRNEILDKSPMSLTKEQDKELSIIDELLDLMEFLDPIENYYKNKNPEH